MQIKYQSLHFYITNVKQTNTRIFKNHLIEELINCKEKAGYRDDMDTTYLASEEVQLQTFVLF